MVQIGTPYIKMKYNQLTILLIISILSLTLVSADYLPHETNQNLSYSFTDDLATQCNATTLINPDGSISNINQELSYSSGTFSGLIKGSNFTGDGVYCINIICDEGYGSVCRDVTPNGRARPDGVTILLFALLFLSIIVTMTGSLLYIIFKFIELNFTAKDLIVSVSIYFGVFAYFILEKYYLGNSFIGNFTEVTILAIGGLTHILIPLIAFFVSWFKEHTDKQQAEIDGSFGD